MPRSWESYYREQEMVALGEHYASCIQAVLDDWEVASLHALNRMLYRCTTAGVSLGVQTWDQGYFWSGSEGLWKAQPGDAAALGVGAIVEGSDAEVPHRFCRVEEYDEQDPQDYARDFRMLVEAVDAEACALAEEVD